MNGHFLYSIIDISDEEFMKISKLVYDKFGINLTNAKKELVKGRLNKILKQLGFTSFNDYYNHVINDSSNESLLQMIDKISTNHTFFYRESDHFEYLSYNILPELTSKNKELRIWCAGCATGEEAYTLAMVLKEFFINNTNKYDISILATDISVSALEKAVEGIYPIERTIKLPETYKKKYLINKDAENVMIKDEIRNMILFKRLNFINDNFPFKGKFDIIFCRNVMIYFDNVTRINLVNKLYDVLNDSSYLFIGHSESLLKEATLFKYIKPAIYKKK